MALVTGVKDTYNSFLINHTQCTEYNIKMTYFQFWELSLPLPVLGVCLPVHSALGICLPVHPALSVLCPVHSVLGIRHCVCTVLGVCLPVHTLLGVHPPVHTVLGVCLPVHTFLGVPHPVCAELGVVGGIVLYVPSYDLGGRISSRADISHTCRVFLLYAFSCDEVECYYEQMSGDIHHICMAFLLCAPSGGDLGY